MNKSKFLIPIFIFLMIFPIFSVVNATQTYTWGNLIDTIGDWNVDEYGHWKVDNIGNNLTNGVSHYQIGNIFNFSGFVTKWNITTFGTRIPSWWWSSHNELDFAWKITGSDGTSVFTNGKLDRSADILFQDHVASFEWGINTEWDLNPNYMMQQSNQGWIYNGTLAIWKNGDNITFTVPYFNVDWNAYFNSSAGWSFQTSQSAIKGLMNAVWDSNYINYTLPVSSGWFDDITIDLWIGWQGHPNSEIYLNTNPIYTDGEMPPLTPIPEDGSYILDHTARPFYDYFPEPLRSILEIIMAVIEILFIMIQLLITVVLIIIPWTPYILLLYIFDATIKCVQTRSFQPMGTLFEKIFTYSVMAFNIIVQVGEFIYSLGQAIWNILSSVFGLLGLGVFFI